MKPAVFLFRLLSCSIAPLRCYLCPEFCFGKKWRRGRDLYALSDVVGVREAQSASKECIRLARNDSLFFTTYIPMSKKTTERERFELSVPLSGDSRSPGVRTKPDYATSPYY